MGKFMEKKLRKRETQLADAGMGVILFAVWAVAKVNLFLAMSGFFLEDVYKIAEENGIGRKFFVLLVFVIIAVLLIWQLSTRLYIGICAVREGKGKPQGKAYLVLAAVLLITELQSVLGMLVTRPEENIPDAIMSLCLEAASVYILLELLTSGIFVKHMRKKRKA